MLDKKVKIEILKINVRIKVFCLYETLAGENSMK